MLFEEMELSAPILASIDSQGYENPTPIQQQAIPLVLAGRDVLGSASTGTGKTAAFALPILQMLANRPTTGSRRPIRALVLTPTRELAAQIAECFSSYGRGMSLCCVPVYGGERRGPQIAAVRKGVDILVATPGRLLDLMQQRVVVLDSVETFVLDEADRMLDMGFIDDIRRVASALPEKRQTLLFSATLPLDIRRLANHLLCDPAEVRADPPSSTLDLVEQNVRFVEKSDKLDLLVHTLADPSVSRVLVFTGTKHAADRVTQRLRWKNVSAEVIHGDRTQEERTAALAAFKSGRTRVLVATDVASRGIDVEGITHVVNYDLPNEPEAYVHRIGRTARAGQTGVAITFCAVDERTGLQAIEMHIKKHLDRSVDHPFKSSVGAPPPTVLDPRKRLENRAQSRRMAGKSGGGRNFRSRTRASSGW